MNIDEPKQSKYKQRVDITDSQHQEVEMADEDRLLSEDTDLSLGASNKGNEVKRLEDGHKVDQNEVKIKTQDEEGGGGVEGRAATTESSDVVKSCIVNTADQDDSKRDADTSKAVTFAEDIEVYDLKAGTPITVSLDTPVYLLEPENGAWTIGGNKVEDLKDGAAGLEQGKDQNGFVSADFAPPGSSGALEDVGKETSGGEEKQQQSASATRPSILSLSTDGPAVLEDTTIAAVGMGQTSLEGAEGKDKEEHGSTEPDQKFIVSAVDESELLVESGPSGEEGGNNANIRVPSSLSLKRDETFSGDTPHLLKESSASGHSSHSNDSMQHDTIGPLENPAFLKTLQYSSSQRFDEEEQFGLHSNIDLSSLAVGQNDPNLDGGWAWVVLVAAFVNLIILSASCLLAGVMMTSYLEVTKADMTQTSWIGSVYISIMCLAGPFVGTVTRRFGARPTICVAGFVMFLGFLGASFSNTVIHLILTHSLVAGVGAGLAINPTFVIVGQYFNRLRGLACGLMATGGGAGFLAGGALISQFLSTYDLGGAYLIWAAICFNITAMGMLMRPSPEEKLRLAERNLMIDDVTIFNATSQQELASGHNSMMSGLNSMYSGTDQQSMYSGMTSEGRRSYLQRYPNRQTSGGDADMPLLKTIFHREMSRSSHSMSTNRSSYSHRHHRSQNQISSSSMQRVHSPYESNTAAPSSPIVSPSALSPLTITHNGRNALSTHNITSTNSLATTHMQSTSTLAAPSSSVGAPASPTSTRVTTRSSFHRPRLMSSISQPTSHYTSLSYISQRLSFRDGMGNHRDLDNESITSTLVNNLRPCDTLTPRYALGSMSISAVIGSLASFPTSLAIINDDLSRVDRIPDSRQRDKTVKDYIIDVLDSLRVIFNNRPFVAFLGTCFLWAFGESPVMLYLSSYAISCGTDPMQASALYTAMGVGSIIGRFLTGLIATDTKIGPMLLHIGCLGLAGILVILSPLITSTVLEQMLFSSLLGLYTGSLVPLMSLMTIELLGISELSVGFGFLYMAQGFGYLIGPPLAGVLVGQIGFHYSFVFAGCLLICGSLVGLTIPMLINVEDEDDNNSMDELERALHKVANEEGSSSGSEGEDNEDDDTSKKGKDDDLNKKVEVPSQIVGSAGENHHQHILLPEDSTFMNMVRTLDEGDDKLETIKEIM